MEVGEPRLTGPGALAPPPAGPEASDASAVGRIFGSKGGALGSRGSSRRNTEGSGGAVSPRPTAGGDSVYCDAASSFAASDGYSDAASSFAGSEGTASSAGTRLSQSLGGPFPSDSPIFKRASRRGSAAASPAASRRVSDASSTGGLSTARGAGAPPRASSRAALSGRSSRRTSATGSAASAARRAAADLDAPIGGGAAVPPIFKAARPAKAAPTVPRATSKSAGGSPALAAVAAAAAAAVARRPARSVSFEEEPWHDTYCIEIVSPRPAAAGEGTAAPPSAAPAADTATPAELGQQGGHLPGSANGEKLGISSSGGGGSGWEQLTCVGQLPRVDEHPSATTSPSPPPLAEPLLQRAQSQPQQAVVQQPVGQQPYQEQQQKRQEETRPPQAQRGLEALQLQQQRRWSGLSGGARRWRQQQQYQYQQYQQRHAKLSSGGQPAAEATAVAVAEERAVEAVSECGPTVQVAAATDVGASADDQPVDQPTAQQEDGTTAAEEIAPTAQRGEAKWRRRLGVVAAIAVVVGLAASTGHAAPVALGLARAIHAVRRRRR